MLDVETDAALVATRDKAIIMRKLGELSIPAEAKAVRKATVKAEAAVKKMQEVQVSKRSKGSGITNMLLSPAQGSTLSLTVAVCDVR